MMYSEFVAGTGCKDNRHNYKVFENLEAMYMNTNMTKQEVYEYGKKLVDNSKSEKELQFESEIKGQIEDLKNDIKSYQDRIDTLKMLLIGETDKYWIASWKQEIKTLNGHIKSMKIQINGLKWVLA